MAQMNDYDEIEGIKHNKALPTQENDNREIDSCPTTGGSLDDSVRKEFPGASNDSTTECSRADATLATQFVVPCEPETPDTVDGGGEDLEIQDEELTDLYNQFKPALLKYAASLTNGYAGKGNCKRYNMEPQDLVHDAFGGACEHRSTIPREATKIRSFLYRCIRNRFFNELNWARKRPGLVNGEDESRAIANLPGRFNPFTDAVSNEYSEAFESALVSLSRRDAEDARMRFIEGCTNTEIASVTGQHRSTVSKHNKKSAEHLARELWYLWEQV
jgi:RNA polymerase sigma factor (sigma-70 family)